jgi:hypothetical protein
VRDTIAAHHFRKQSGSGHLWHAMLPRWVDVSAP